MSFQSLNDHSNERLSATDWEAIFARGANASLLVMGDLILDEYLWGSVRRISPEAPVPVMLAHDQNVLPGGAANVAVNLASLGCRVAIAGVVGDDDRGERLRALLSDRGVRCDGVVRDASRMTTLKTRVMAANQQMLRIDREVIRPYGAAVADELLGRLGDALDGCAAFVCSDYGKGLFSAELTPRLFEAPRRAGVPIFVDPKGNDYERYRGATVLTPNKREMREAAGMPVESEAELAAAAVRLLEVVGAEAVLVTRGEEGMTLYGSRGDSTHIPTAAQEVFDVTGAGDTVISALAFALAAGASLRDAAFLANVAAGLVVRRLGTAVATLDELRQRLAGQDQISPRKVVDLPELRQAIGNLRANGKRIVFTNGCFDILHAGHLKYLEAARQFGDLLVVAVNDDDSVLRLKGPPRPLLAVKERTEVLAGLSCVDYVTVFSDDTPLRLIEAVRPDVLVKGADYRLDEVVGRAEVERYGGRIELVPLAPGQSTTRIVSSILGKYGVAPAAAPPSPPTEES